MLSLLFYIDSIEVMNDRSRMYRDSPQRLWRMDYYNGVQSFINFVKSITRNISRDGISVHAGGVKIKSFFIQIL
jgi:hypothetical protein